MQIPGFIPVVGGIVLFIILAVIVLFFIQSRRQASANDKPPLYTHDKGEKLAAPFAEQIEDILHELMKNNPQLTSLKVDLGSSATGELEIWVDGTQYAAVEEIPNPALQEAIQQAITQWKE